MSAKFYYITFLLLLATHCGTAQLDSSGNGSFVLSKYIKADIVDFTVDNLGNIYLISKDNLLKKLDANGDSAAVFNEVSRYGNIWSIDVTNPLKILIYYKDFATIVVVDRFLNIRTTIDLRSQNILQAKAIGLGYDNNIWVYDELDAKLKRLRDDGSLVDQTTDFRQIFDTVPDPSIIADQSGLVYLYDINRGVFAFDHYGGFKTTLPLTGWQDFTVIDKILLGRDQSKFYRYQLGTLNLEEIPIPPAYLGAIKIKITPGAIYVLKKKGLEIYSRR